MLANKIHRNNSYLAKGTIRFWKRCTGTLNFLVFSYRFVQYLFPLSYHFQRNRIELPPQACVCACGISMRMRKSTKSSFCSLAVIVSFIIHKWNLYGNTLQITPIERYKREKKVTNIQHGKYSSVGAIECWEINIQYVYVNTLIAIFALVFLPSIGFYDF